jgi:hypothetical protein
MPDSARTQQIKDLIRSHLAEVGSKRWKAVRLQCPDISDATFWRYRTAVRDENEEKLDPGPSSNHSASQAPDDDVPNLGALPAFYNPLKKARSYESLLADADTMRAQAVDHRGRIINWRMFEKSIQLRERLISQLGDTMEFFQDQEATKQFFAQVVEIMDELPKEIAEKFVKRLYHLQERRLAPSNSSVTTKAVN